MSGSGLGRWGVRVRRRGCQGQVQDDGMFGSGAENMRVRFTQVDRTTGSDGEYVRVRFTQVDRI